MFTIGSFRSGIVSDQQGITWLLCKTVVVPMRIHSQKLFGCRLEVDLPLKDGKKVKPFFFIAGEGFNTCCLTRGPPFPLSAQLNKRQVLQYKKNKLS